MSSCQYMYLNVHITFNDTALLHAMSTPDDKRADYDRLISIFSAYIYNNKPVVLVCR